MLIPLNPVLSSIYEPHVPDVPSSLPTHGNTQLYITKNNFLVVIFLMQKEVNSQIEEGSLEGPFVFVYYY